MPAADSHPSALPAIRRGSLLPAVPLLARVECIPNILAPLRVWRGTVPAFVTLAEAVDGIRELAGVPSMFRRGGRLLLNGRLVPATCWAAVRVQPGDDLYFQAVPQGGGFWNSMLKVVAAVVGIAISVWAPFGTATFLAMFGNALLATGATVGLSLLANVIAPVRPPSLPSFGQDSRAASPTYSLNASSNQMGFGKPVRVVLGRHKIPFTRILDDYTELEGQDEYLYFLGVAGYGPLQLERLRLGDTDLDAYQGVTLQLCYGNEGEAVPDLLPTVVYQTALSLQLVTTDSVGNDLAQDAWWVTRSTEAGVDTLGVGIQAPQGLYSIDDRANRSPISRSVEVRCRVRAGVDTPAGEWHGMSAEVVAQTLEFPRAILPAYTIRSEDSNITVSAVSFAGTCLVYLNQSGNFCVARFSAKNGEPIRSGSWWKPVYTGTAEVTQPTLPGGSTLLATVTVTGDRVSGWQLSPAATAAGITATQPAPLRLALSGGTVQTDYSIFTLHGIGAMPDKAVRLERRWRVPYSATGYDVQVRRTSGQSKSTKVIDPLYWSALKAMDSTQKAYVGKHPLAMAALKVKATNQIQNQLEVFTAIATAVLPDWDRESKAWITRATRNPASAYVAVLRGPANPRPCTDDQIDWETLQTWHEWCDDNGYLFDGVYDTQTKVYDVLADIAAAGRGSPVCCNGLWGVVWQHKLDGQPRGDITVRNSRDFSSSIEYREPIHGLRVQYISEDDDYEQAELTVYAPGYDASTATLFDMVELYGTTSPAQAAIRGRWHLGQALLLTEKYSVTMPLEYLRLRKGDKVRVVRPETLYGLGAAALKSWELDDAGQVVSLRWDSLITVLTPSVRYGVVVRLYDGSEWTVAGTCDDGLTFVLDAPVPPPTGGPDGTTILLRPGDLVMVGAVQDVGRMCLVTHIKPGDDLTAEVGLIDYVEELYGDDGGKIPPYDPSITLPGTGPLRKAATPLISLVRSDEWALAALPGGGTQPRIYIAWEFADASRFAQVQFRERDGGQWEYAGTLPAGAVNCWITGVREGYDVVDGVRRPNGVSYDIRVRAVNDLGWTSDWALVAGHVVIGRTTPPPAPDIVYLDGYAVRAQLESRPLDVVGFEVRMAFDATDTLDMSKRLTSPYVEDGRFDLTPWAGRARRIFVRTVDELGLYSEARDLLIEFGDVQPANVLLEYSQQAQGWPGSLTGGNIGLLDRLYADSSTFVFPDDPAAFVFPETADAPVFATADGQQLVYTFQFTVPSDVGGARLLVMTDLVAGHVQAIDWRHYTVPFVFPDDSEAFVFPDDSEAFVFPTVVAGDWTPMPSNYVTPGNEIVDIRVTLAAGDIPAVVDDIRMIVDVEDRVTRVDSARVPAAGARLPLPAGQFRRVLNVTFGLESVAGLTARVPVIIDKNGGARDDKGFLLEGPLVRGLDENGQPAEMQVDATISGY